MWRSYRTPTLLYISCSKIHVKKIQNTQHSTECTTNTSSKESLEPEKQMKGAKRKEQGKKENRDGMVDMESSRSIKECISTQLLCQSGFYINELMISRIVLGLHLITVISVFLWGIVSASAKGTFLRASANQHCCLLSQMYTWHTKIRFSCHKSWQIQW